jgi:SAM-dependent methyltransferase
MYKYATSDERMKKNASEGLALCKTCDRSDWLNDEWQETRREMHLRNDLHRKPWEFIVGAMGLNRLNLLRKDAIALGLGCASEIPIFHFANKIKKVIATDVCYQVETPYGHGNLELLRMDACENVFDDGMFDFVFSFCAIEHFPRERVKDVMLNVERVLKPGGVAVISTELNMGNISGSDMFTECELYEYLIDSTEMALIENIDFRVSKSLVNNPLDVTHGAPKDVYPHIVLKIHEFVFTSIILFLRRKNV